MKGEKRVEFRKVRFRSEISHIVVYASSPLQRIVGYFEVSHVDVDSPSVLWARYSAVAGIPQSEFQAYYGSYDRGVAVGVGKVSALRNPVPLTTLGESIVAPQSFMYITPEAFEIIRRYS